MSPRSTRCPTCGYANRPTARLCSECLTPLRRDASRHAPTRRRGTLPAQTRARRSASSAADRFRETARASRKRQPERGPWWADWNLGAMALGLLAAVGLRKTDIGETISNIPDQIDGWLDHNL